MSNQVMKYCKTCGTDTIHLQPSTSHVLHLLLSVFTLGIWIIVWFFVAQSNASQAKCTVCGSMKGLFGTTKKGRGAPRTADATPATHVLCPDCAEPIRREARVCKHCGCKLQPQV